MGKKQSRLILENSSKNFDEKLKINPERLSIVRAVADGAFGSVYLGNFDKNGRKIQGKKKIKCSRLRPNF